MNSPVCANRVEEVLGFIEPALARIESEAADADRRDLHETLRRALINLMRLLERDPGIETATADLYAAATVLAETGPGRTLPAARKMRLFRDARARFRERIARARPCDFTDRPGWRLEELLLSA
jgi:hypothetical protein